MNKEGSKYILISFIILIILVIVMFLYFALFKVESNYYERKIASGDFLNPVLENVNSSEEDFGERHIEYWLYTFKAYELHNPPLSFNIPVISLEIEDEKYYAEIVKGEIRVYSGENEGDLLIKTSKSEIIKMIKEESYASESFSSGKSSVGLIAGKTELFSKGYLNLYTELTGKSITGSVVRIYLD